MLGHEVALRGGRGRRDALLDAGALPALPAAAGVAAAAGAARRRAACPHVRQAQR